MENPQTSTVPCRNPSGLDDFVYVVKETKNGKLISTWLAQHDDITHMAYNCNALYSLKNLQYPAVEMGLFAAAGG